MQIGVNAAGSNPPAALLEARQRKFIFLLCCLAAIHVFLFSVAFPLINNVDEQAHLDMVVKYSHGQIPRGIEPASKETLRYLVVYGSFEFLWPPDIFTNGQFPPPPWTQPLDKVTPMLLAREAAWRGENHEVSQPPLYYALAGLWWRAGQWLGFEGGRLLYWVRFLNIFFVAALVWLGYFTARTIFPETKFLRLGVPALLAFMPQSAFYSIQNDVPSPLCFGAAFLLLLKFLRADVPGGRLGTAAGLALATTFLTKMSNLPLLAVSGAAVLFKIFTLAKAGKLRAAAPSILALALCAGLPMALWMAWCKHNFGDFTGSELKIQFLGWTLKPFADWWHHPLFTPRGFWNFISGLLATFWRGEITWHGRPLALPPADLFYAISSIGLPGVALAALWRRPAMATSEQRLALGFGLACFVSLIGFLAFLSIIYDFHNCVYPSRHWPYFTSGRLMLGALIPFLLVFTFGMNCALNKFRDAVKFIALAAMILFMLVSEIAADWPVFSSQYNWFHM
jgi:Predicted membrane protein (DUF2142)